MESTPGLGTGFYTSKRRRIGEPDRLVSTGLATGLRVQGSSGGAGPMPVNSLLAVRRKLGSKRGQTGRTGNIGNLSTTWRR